MELATPSACVWYFPENNALWTFLTNFKKEAKLLFYRSLSMIVIYSNDFFKRSTRVSSLWILLYSLIILLEIFDLPCTYTRNFPKFVNIADVIVIFSHWVSGLDYAAWITVLFGDESIVKLLKVSFLLTNFCKPSSENLMPSSGNCAHMQLISLTQTETIKCNKKSKMYRKVPHQKKN